MGEPEEAGGIFALCGSRIVIEIILFEGDPLTFPNKVYKYFIDFRKD